MGKGAERILARVKALADVEAEATQRISEAFAAELASMTLTEASHPERDENPMGEAVAAGFAAGAEVGAERTAAEHDIEPAAINSNQAAAQSSPTAMRIAETNRNAIADAESDEEIAELYEDWQGTRSALIAGNLVWAGYSFGARLTVGEHGTKKWWTVGDARVDADCWEMEGLGTIPIPEEFPKGDPPGPHPGCRCDVEYQPE